MAKVILSAAVGNASKSIGGITFTHGPFGAQIGIKLRPINSESNAQLEIRQGFQALSKRWATVLTAAQQAGWLAFAAAHQVHDSLGQLITLTGVQSYIRLNGALKAAGQATIDVAPGAVSAGNPGAITVSPNATGPPSLSVAVTNAPGVNDVPIVWSMNPTTIGNRAVLKKLRIIQVFPPGTAGPFNVLATWNGKFGLLITSQVIVCKVQYTDSTTGWQGTSSVAAGVCT